MASRFPTLLKPLALNNGRVTLKNRVLMGSMHSGLEEILKNNQLEDMAEYFAEVRGVYTRPHECSAIIASSTITSAGCRPRLRTN